ncbi:hypothetical protein GPECTOR_8g87 [Gonium pectorale]|uniref:Protein kinase domain-containing protein n=1 Tax=Gonium pectorale TaxID=33097 RepID=A0A150GTA5_GONPE|nr:hypothetical protein GPECTOR_8g87 [Gonium pectorale]|eukprot:KXZ53096.1 hypothetical protein GPECTOR_8g87 [Gonium pectorale]
MQVALKRVGDVFASPDYAKRVLREVCIMRRLEHPNIVRLKDVFLKPSPTGKYVFRGGRLVPTSFDCYIAMEACDQGDLFNMRGQLPEHEVRSLMWQLLSALRDIKTGNLLLTLSEGRRVLKVADFGSARSAKHGSDALESSPQDDAEAGLPSREPGCQDANDGDGDEMELQDDITSVPQRPPPRAGSTRRRTADGAAAAVAPAGPRTVSAMVAVPAANGGYEPPLTSLVCTPCYRAPEVVMSRGNYSSAIDMWSAGCVFGELLQRAAYVGKASTPHLQVAPVFAVTGKPLTPRTGQRYGVAEPQQGAYAESAYAELSALFNVIGTPAWACIEAVQSPAWRRYLFHVPGRAPTLHRRFGQAGEVAVDLLARMLQFDPVRRASAEEAMQHEWFAMMHMEAQMAAAELASRSIISNRPRRAQPDSATSRGPPPGSGLRDSDSSADGTDPAPLPTWPPAGASSRHASVTGTPREADKMEVEAECLVATAGVLQPSVSERVAAVSLHGDAVCAAARRERSGGGAGGAGLASGSLLTKRKQLEDMGESPADAERQHQLRQPQGQAGPGPGTAGPAEKRFFWQIDEPALALAALEEELALLVPPDTPTTSGAAMAAQVARMGARAATAAQSPDALAFVERVKDRLREMLERECEEHAARAAARLAQEAHPGDGGLAPAAGGSAGRGGSAGGGLPAGLTYVRRINSEGAMLGPDGQVLQASGVAAALHGHLRPDPGSHLDPSWIGYERIPYHADSAAAKLEPEKHLWAGRHGEWTESSLAGQRREQSAGTWGVTLLPPGTEEDSAAGRTVMQAVRSQHAR